MKPRRSRPKPALWLVVLAGLGLGDVGALLQPLRHLRRVEVIQEQRYGVKVQPTRAGGALPP